MKSDTNVCFDVSLVATFAPQNSLKKHYIVSKGKGEGQYVSEISM